MQPPSGGHGRDVLHRHEAAERSDRVHAVSYTLVVELSERPPGYHGRALVEFGLRGGDGPLFLDFRGGPVSVVVNGRSVEVDHREHRLWLPASSLAERNRVEVEYENAYDTSGEGVHHFVDPEDGETYVYSNFEPFSAHRLLPCFDQPDLKASYELTVDAPAHWSVVSAEPRSALLTASEGRRRHVFPRSPVFSTYLLPLMAGPWERIEARQEDGLDLGVLGRRSMRRELERSADEIADITRQGIRYYGDLFGRPFPFNKYDQLFVPEFNSGAMENVGAVTFADHYLFRDPPTYSQRLLRAEVILHELAHMWFGDLVTMRWWDDLWLNETFATYLSYRCLAEGTAFRDAWQVFNGELRPAAQRQDQLVTTHPVATVVASTDQAVGNFDAITYEKGAAVIKQLVAAIGDDAFRSGLQAYFERHAWGNATLTDFLAALGDAAGEPLDEWARAWLQTASINEIGVHRTEEEGRLSGLDLEQGVLPGHTTLRPHSTHLALLRPSPSGGLEVESVPVTIAARRASVPAAAGRPAPLFIYPDHGDHDYALVRLDPVSLAFALERLPEIPEALLRQQTWSTLYEMVRGASLRAVDYLSAVRRFAPLETDRALVSAILERAAEVLRRFLPIDDAQVEARTLVATATAAVDATSDDLRLTWVRAAVALAADAADVEGLIALADDASGPSGFVVDQELRWELTVKAMAHGLPGASERLDGELRRDPSDRGQRAFIRAQASRPDAASKAEVWRRVHEEGFGSDYLTRAAIAGFQWRHQREVLLPFRDPFYGHLAQVYATRERIFARSYARGLVPDRWAEPSELERLRGLREELSPEQVLLARDVDEIADDLARDIRVHAFGRLEAEAAQPASAG